MRARRAALPLLGLACVLAGCLSPQQVRDDIRRSRDAAFREWQRGPT